MRETLVLKTLDELVAYTFKMDNGYNRKWRLDLHTNASRPDTLWLTETGDHIYRPASIQLDGDLAALVEKAWPVKQDRWGSDKRTPRTLEGILKLLGQSAGDQLKAAREKAEVEREEARLADISANVRKLATDLGQYLAKSGAEVGVAGVRVTGNSIILFDSVGSVIDELPLPKEA